MKIKQICKEHEKDLILLEEENKKDTKDFEKILNNMIKKLKRKHNRIAQ